MSARLDPPPGSMPHPALRLFAFAGAMAAGVLLAEAVAPAPAIAVASGAIAGSILIGASYARRRAAAALLAAALLGVALAGVRLASLDRSALAAGAREGADAVLVGRVLEDPEARGGDLRMVVGVDAAEIDSRPVRVRERVLLVVRPPVEGIVSGDRLRADVRLSPLLRGGPDVDAALKAAAARLRYAGVAARAYARARGIEDLGPARDLLSRVARTGRGAMTRAVSHLPERDAGLLLGVTIGDTSRLDVAMEQDFRDTGLSHLTAVSGENLAMFLGALAFVLRLARLRRRATVLTLALGTIAFVSITRFEPSVLRAGGMAAVGLAGVVSGARREALTALGATCVALLLWDPFLIHVPGFQLSALATIGILTLGPRLTETMGRGKLGAIAAVTLAAQLAVAPLIALTFHRFTLVALPANVLALPAVAPATVLGFVAATVGAIVPPLGTILATLARPSLTWMAGVARTFARVPAATVDVPGGLAGLVALALICALPALALRVRMPRRAAPVLLAVALLATTTAWARALGPPHLHGLTITALDVGQGDAWLVRTPRGATMLVDGGPDASRTLAALRAHGIRRVDLLVLTHPHADHVDGLPVVAGAYAVGRGMEPGLDAPLPALRGFRDALRSAGVELDVVRRGARYALGEAVVDVLGPATLVAGTDSDLNNNSVVLRIRFGMSCVMMSGEGQEEGQQALLDAGESLRCPIMTVPHHGSKHMLPAYFAAVAPRVALISVGARNTFGHPSGETLAALAQLRVLVLRTDEMGEISAAIAADGTVDVRTAHPAQHAT